MQEEEEDREENKVKNARPGFGLRILNPEPQHPKPQPLTPHLQEEEEEEEEKEGMGARPASSQGLALLRGKVRPPP